MAVGMAVGSFVLMGTGLTEAQAQIVRWNQIIGVMVPSAVLGGDGVTPLATVGSGTGAVNPGGQPWSTTTTFTRDSATINLATGAMTFRFKGLVLAGGNAVGTRGGVANVVGTLVCDTNGSAGAGNSVLVESPPVPLSLQGDAQFRGNVGPIPAVCGTEPDIAFLIRAGVGGNWIANGAVRVP
jgi:hypothetical protein